MQISFTCFGANESDNRCNGEAKARQAWKKEMVLHVVAIDIFSLVLLPDRFFSSFISATVLVTTGSMRWFLQPNQVAQVVQLLQDGTFICVATGRFAVPPSTVSRAWWRYQETGSYIWGVEQGHRRASQSSSRTDICSFLQRGTLMEPYKMTSSRLLECMFLTKLLETEHNASRTVRLNNCMYVFLIRIKNITI